MICNLFGKNKKKSCIKIPSGLKNLTELSPRVQFWIPQSPLPLSLGPSIQQVTCVANKHNLEIEQESRTKQQTRTYTKIYIENLSRM